MEGNITVKIPTWSYGEKHDVHQGNNNVSDF